MRMIKFLDWLSHMLKGGILITLCMAGIMYLPDYSEKQNFIVLLTGVGFWTIPWFIIYLENGNILSVRKFVKSVRFGYKYYKE